MTNHYVVPRNPEIPSLTLPEVWAGTPVVTDDTGLPAGWVAEVYPGTQIPPNSSSRIASWRLASCRVIPFLKTGLVFVGPGKVEVKDVISALKATSSFPINAALAGVFPLHNFFLEAMRDHIIAETLFPPEPDHFEQFERSFKAGTVFAIPYVDVVEVSHQNVRGRLWGSTNYVAIAVENKEGVKQGFCTTKMDAPWPGRILEQRIQYEVDYLLRDYARDKVDLPAVLKNVIDGYGDTLKQRKVGEVAKDFMAAIEKELEAKGHPLSKRTAAVLDQLSPMLPYYRRVPSMLYYIEIYEGITRGVHETDPNWKPSLTPQN